MRIAYKKKARAAQHRVIYKTGKRPLFQVLEDMLLIFLKLRNRFVPLLCIPLIASPEME